MAFDSYGVHGSVYGHDIIIMEHHEPDKRKRRMCRCGCRKKATHQRFCNGVCMGDGCEKSLIAFKNKIEKQKAQIKQKRKKLYETFGLKENK